LLIDFILHLRNLLS